MITRRSFLKVLGAAVASVVGLKFRLPEIEPELAPEPLESMVANLTADNMGGGNFNIDDIWLEMGMDTIDGCAAGIDKASGPDETRTWFQLEPGAELIPLGAKFDCEPLSFQEELKKRLRIYIDNNPHDDYPKGENSCYDPVDIWIDRNYLWMVTEGFEFYRAKILDNVGEGYVFKAVNTKKAFPIYLYTLAAYIQFSSEMLENVNSPYIHRDIVDHLIRYKENVRQWRAFLVEHRNLIEV